jgi:hypothetical protein
MDGQTVLAKPLGQDVQYATGVLLTGESHDEVVRITHQEGSTLETRLHLLLEPDI